MEKCKNLSLMAKISYTCQVHAFVECVHSLIIHGVSIDDSELLDTVSSQMLFRVESLMVGTKSNSKSTFETRKF